MNKKLVSLITLLLMVVLQYVNAVSVVYVIPAGEAWNSTNLFSGTGTAKGGNITSLSISTGAAGGATNLTYAITDFPGFVPANGWGYIKRTNAAYPAVSSYLTNMIKITTNFGSGDGNGNYVTYTNYYTNTVVGAMFIYTNSIPAGSNDWRRIAIGSVGSNSTSTILSGDYPFIYGIGFTNNNIGVPITISVNFEPAL